MQKQIPPNLLFKAKGIEVKLALLLEFEPDPLGCENCGGKGFIAIFLATNGPFETPGNPNKFVSKWHDGKWWCAPEGNTDYGTLTAPCPVCGGIRGRGGNISLPAQAPIKQLSERMAK